MEEPKGKMYFLAIIFIIIFIVGVAGFYLYKNNKDAKDYLDRLSSEFTQRAPEKIFNDGDLSTSSILKNVKNASDKVIITVGKEKIYQKDYDVEYKEFQVGNKNISSGIKTIILEKMIRDSLILQLAMKEKIVQQLPLNVYNSPDKDYYQRVRQVEALEIALQKKFTVSSSGTVFTVFIYNLEIGAYPYAQAKKIAYEKIKLVRDRLVAKEINLEQAKDILTKDEELKKIDSARETNVYFDFNTSRGNGISLWKEFDDMLLKTPKNEYTPIYAGKDYIIADNGKSENKEVIYMFGYIKDNQMNGSNNIDTYINENKKHYEIIFN
jgi:hypothetical protein